MCWTSSELPQEVFSTRPTAADVAPVLRCASYSLLAVTPPGRSGGNTKSSPPSQPSSLCLLSGVFRVNLTALMRSLGAAPPPHLCSLAPGPDIDCPASLTPLHFLPAPQHTHHHVRLWRKPEMNLGRVLPSPQPPFKKFISTAAPPTNTLTVNAAGELATHPPTHPSPNCVLGITGGSARE